MAFKKLGVLKNYYISAHGIRRDFYNWKWRLFVALLAALVILYINDYVQDKYALTAVYHVNPQGGLAPADYTLSGKIFNWFMTGMLFGIIALAVLYEGEFILGLRKMINHFEHDAGRAVGNAFSPPAAPVSPRGRKAVKPRKR